MLVAGVQAGGLPAQGSYVRQSGSANTSAEVILHRAEAGQAEISASVIARAAGSTLARTGAIDKHLMVLKGLEGVYEEAPGQGPGCRITLKFSGRTVIVRQVELCSEFGVGIDASGRYRPQDSAYAP